jgi:DNA topoisomerase IA
MSRQTEYLFKECKRTFKLLEDQVTKEDKAAYAYEMKWEQTLSALSQGRYDSHSCLVTFVGELYGKIEELKHRLSNLQKEHSDLKKRVALDDELPF